ncbi:hypothetical protein GKE82_11420 [Conexibacter sp. W3-3-2]|uniref:DUF6361 family protein n=1 Tax=Conexibacter sp. W3-3-2 TaxID=2675227 RepID=UPI0012B947E2|nr:DUF6361 family protein [Conexibacter sp. W3-3-2]MTD44884.1 hypothetical protein [Conexibacter sp. W3-3-2]
MSTLTWLDYSDAERKRALQVVELLGRPETRDELGLGAIRDAFANALFPGISTVQRRARYFLFIPWTFREAEQRWSGRTDTLAKARRAELRLIEALLDTAEDEGDSDGIIGSSARKNLRQVPSMIYWQGLARWGIRRVEGTREQWGRAAARSHGTAIDDDGQIVNRSASWWHASLPDPPEDWPDRASLKLRPVEADYLRERIRKRCPDTMLATLIDRREPWTQTQFAWQLDVPELSNRQQTILRHARRFSELMQGAALLYNHALAIATEDEAREAEHRSSLEQWAAAESGADRTAAQLDELWTLLGDLGSRHSTQTRAFVTEWARLTTDPRSILAGSRFTDLVRARELEVKKRQARLSFDTARETWRGAAGVGQLEYRWASAQRQILDVVNAGTA